MTTETAIIAIAGVILVSWLIYLEYRLRKVFRGKSGMDLEDAMRLVAEELDRLHTSREEHHAILDNVEKRLARSIRGVGTVRFNPFREMGSNQSFATAFLSEHGDGVVISALYGRDHSQVYAKPVTQFTSEFELTPEEEKAIETARPQ